MEQKYKPLDKNHEMKRNLLRAAGIAMLSVGVILFIIGITDFFSSMNSFGPPRKFGLFFISLPMIAVGIALTSAGFMGAAARYTAGEMAPVGKDAVNYMAAETGEGVKTIARSIREGVSEGSGEGAACGKCGKMNPQDALYCNHCGSQIPQKTACPSCSRMNEPDAVYCNKCGFKL